MPCWMAIDRAIEKVSAQSAAAVVSRGPAPDVEDGAVPINIGAGLFGDAVLDYTIAAVLAGGGRGRWRVHRKDKIFGV